VLNPQPHVFFRLLNTRIEKSLFKNNKKARAFKLLSKINFYRQNASPQKVPPGARHPQSLPLATPLYVMFSDKFLMSDVLATNLMLTGLFFSHFL